MMQLIVGLGNIGKEYEKTRHNFGFIAVEELAKQFEFTTWKEEKKFFGSICTGQIQDEKVMLLKPNTLMNLSGKAVGAVSKFYKISPSDIWIWHDDVDLEFEKVRIKLRGGSGGHNGIKSTTSNLGSPEYARLKFGMKTEMLSKMPTSNFVLGKFNKEELEKIPTIIKDGVNKFLEQIKC